MSTATKLMERGKTISLRLTHYERSSTLKHKKESSSTKKR
jgi:hypothetical protein